MVARLATLLTDRIYNLPIIVLMPHSRCNCRCIMCDIWKANHNKTEIAADLIAEHIALFKAWKVREVVLSGGEPLMHQNLWSLCEQIRKAEIKITLLSTGLLLEKNASKIVQYIDNVIISIDGPADIHDTIRNVPGGFEKIKTGIAMLRKEDPRIRITGRSVLQRANFRRFVDTVRAAKSIGLDQISFLPADTTSFAFNHTEDRDGLKDISLNAGEAAELESLIRLSFDEIKEHYEKHFIAETRDKMLRIPKYYAAHNGLDEFPSIACNAPWVSAVIESNGDVMPCFFHKPYGNIHGNQLHEILNSAEAISFRKKLDTKTDPTCRRCVCTLKLGVTEML
jgi:MoaA/NifB/PqqE/SkfB family radical SAM enzyme